DHLGGVQQLDGTYGQQTRVTGAGAHERHPSGGGGLVRCLARSHGLLLPHWCFHQAGASINSAAPAASIWLPSRSPMPTASPGSPVALMRTTRLPSPDRATALIQSSSPSSASTTSARAPSGALHPA